MRLDDPRLLLDEHAVGDEEDGEVPCRLPHAVRVGAQQHPRDERLPGPRVQENHRVPAHRPLKRLQLVPAQEHALATRTSVAVRRRAAEQHSPSR